MKLIALLSFKMKATGYYHLGVGLHSVIRFCFVCDLYIYLFVCDLYFKLPEIDGHTQAYNSRVAEKKASGAAVTVLISSDGTYRNCYYKR